MGIRRVREWVRVVWCPDVLIWLPISILLAIWLFDSTFSRLAFLIARSIAPLLNDTELYVPMLRPVHQGVVLFFALLYGLVRGYQYHPLNQRSYGVWLAQSPWCFPQPLPFGPAHLVRQDAVFMTMLMLFWMLPPRDNSVAIWWIPILLIGSYSATLILSLLRFDLHWINFVAFLVAALVVIVCPRLPMIAMLTCALYLLAFVRLENSLRDFPYDEHRREKLGLLSIAKRPPADVSLPMRPEPTQLNVPIGLGRSLSFSVVIGVAFFAAAFHFRNEPRLTHDAFIGNILVTILLVGGRLSTYCVNHLPPISIFGRFVTRRFVIPNYDKVFVAPLVAAAVGFLLPPILLGIGFATIVVLPLTAGITTWLTLSMPPDLTTWHYTGHHRVPAPRRVGKDFTYT